MSIRPLLFAMLAIVPALPAPAEEPAWWDAKWQARRTFECTGTRSELSGDEVGVVEFLTAGLAAADGRDVRVLPKGIARPLAVKVLATGPGDFLRICFPLVKDVTTYTVYYGNAAAGACESFEPRRGLLMEMRTYRGGQPDSLKGMQEVVKKAGPLQGSDFVDRVFFGHNPFGPRDRYVAIYTGWLKCPADGEYTFATSSDDASFLLVDDRQVVAWPGWHGAVPDIRHKGQVKLAAGLHKLEYLHVNGEGDGTAVAAWQPPGHDRVEVIPADAFSRVSRGRQTAYSLRGQPAAADFAFRSDGEAYLDDDRYLVRAAFRAGSGAAAAPTSWKCSWDFGDGQTANGASPEHVYILPGLYKVTLRVEASGAKLECANAVRIDRDMARAVAGKSDRLADYARALSGYDLAKLSPASLLELSAVYKELEQPEGQLAAARAILARPAGQFGDQDCFDQLLVAVGILRENARGAEGRAEAFRLLDAAEDRFRKSKNDGLRAQVIRERGDIYYYYAGDLDKAYNEYDKVVAGFRGLSDNIVRVTKIRLGDIHRERGNYAEAERRYKEAEALKLYRQKPEAEDARRGALAHAAESHLKFRQMEECERALNIWEWEYPIEKLVGYSSLLRCRLETMRKNGAEVVKQAEVLLKVNPRSDYAGELLLIEAQAQKALGKPDKAVECLKRIVSEHPECEQAAEARKLLEARPPEPAPKAK